MQHLFSNYTKLLLLAFLLSWLIMPFSHPLLAADESVTPVIDGVVQPHEYVHSIRDGDSFELYWSLTTTRIYFALVGKTTGWIGIGIDPTYIMKDADMILGWVNQTGSFIHDAFATKITGGFEDDTSLGGAFNIDSWQGHENATHTILEFTRVLDTGDAYDAKLHLNESVSIVWAIGGNGEDNDSTAPAGVGQFTIDLSLRPGVTLHVTNTDFNPYLFLGILAFLFLVSFSLAITTFYFLYWKKK